MQNYIMVRGPLHLPVSEEYTLFSYLCCRPLICDPPFPRLDNAPPPLQETETTEDIRLEDRDVPIAHRHVQFVVAVLSRYPGIAFLEHVAKCMES